jgi:hypothetical protein
MVVIVVMVVIVPGHVTKIATIGTMSSSLAAKRDIQTAPVSIDAAFGTAMIPADPMRMISQGDDAQTEIIGRNV